MTSTVHRWLTTLVAAGLALVLSGCSALQSPFDESQSYRRGERPSYSIGQMTNQNTGNCEDNDKNCVVFSKLVLTKPSDNLSFQIIRRSKDAKGRITEEIVTCVSPAEAGKTVSTSGSFSTSIPAKVGGAAASASAAASSAATEALVVLKSIDPATQYVATASFANCLAYAGGMYDGAAAARLQEKIFDNAVPISGAASAPKQ
jgi:hypothetical protein